MPTYTAVAGGGNWNSAATWGGVGPPIAGDTAILNATSGQVTVTADAICLILDCTGYANTLTINTGFSLRVTGTGATISLGGTISTAQQGVLSTIGSNNTVTINFNGVTIPRLTCGHTTSAATQTVTANGATPTISNLRISPSFSNSIVSITNQVTITNSLIFTTGTLAGTAFTINGSVTFDGVGAATPILTSGFTIPSGSTVILNDLLLINGGTYTFNVGSNLTTNNNALQIGGTVTLNTSPVIWHSITLGGTVTLTSDLNVLTNVTGASAITSSVSRNINIQGGWFINTSGSPVTCTNIVINFIGTGTIYTRDSQAVILSSPFTNCTININTTNPSGYVLGTTVGGASYNYFSLNNSTLNLVGNSSTATMFDSSTRVLLFGNCTLSTNLTGSGGNQIIYSIVDLRTGTTTLNSDTTVSTDLISFDTATATINGSRFLLTGNCTSPSTRTYSGTSTIEFIGSNNQNWSTGTFQNNITINKSGGTVNLLGSFTWGAAGRTLQRTAGNINVGTSTVTIPNAAVTINNMVFNNLTVTAGAAITQNTANTINSTLQLNGSTTFAGTAGWTCGTLICTTNNSTITLQNSVTYRTTTGVQLVSSLTTQPITMVSNNASIRAIWTLDYGATQNIIYVNGTRIDSSLGQTIWTFGGLISTTPVGAETLNWRTGTRPGTIAYVFLN